MCIRSVDSEKAIMRRATCCANAELGDRAAATAGDHAAACAYGEAETRGLINEWRQAVH